MREAAVKAPLTEIMPASPGDALAAFGLAIAWSIAACATGPILYAIPDTAEAEHGALYAGGLAQFGVALERFTLVRAHTQGDALWAAEQALRTPHALALCVVAANPKPLSLTSSRRLLLAAESASARCVLLRFDPAGASAAWTRWSIAAAPSSGAERELGPPRFHARLVRNRAGPNGASWLVEWSPHDHVFRACEHGALDGAVATAPVDRSAAPRQRRVS